MHHGDDENKLRFDGVQNSVGKDTREAATNVVIQDSPTFGAFENSVDCVLNGFDKPQGKSPDRARRSKGLPPDTPRAPPGGTDMSSAKGGTDLLKSLLSRDGFAAPASHFITPALCFRKPQAVDVAEFVRIQALHEKIREPRTRFRR